MRVANSINRVGNTFISAIPNWLSEACCSPVYRLFGGLSGEGWAVNYNGGGEFEAVGDFDERMLGSMEALASIAPALYTIAIIQTLDAVAPRPAASIGIVVFGLIALIQIGQIGEVTIRRVDSA